MAQDIVESSCIIISAYKYHHLSLGGITTSNYTAICDTITKTLVIPGTYMVSDKTWYDGQRFALIGGYEQARWCCMLKIGNQDGELVLVQFDIGGVTIFSLMSPLRKGQIDGDVKVDAEHVGVDSHDVQDSQAGDERAA
uniref:Uncharacterized protein n=2 Tax=Oryza TaxID=4527 RepID=A0A0D3GHI2_9ORYZ